MRVSILADSGPGIGLGHVGRCTGLAQGIEKESGVKPTFYVEDQDARTWIRQRGFPLGKHLPGKSDLMIVDSYNRRGAILIALRKKTKQLFVMDDLGQPFTGADWILNSAPLIPRFSYPNKFAERLLRGPEFHPLRREYWGRQTVRVTHDPVRRLIIILGGGDSRLLLNRVVCVVRDNVPEAFCHVVVGPMSKVELSTKGNIRIHVSPKNLRILFEQCDIAITGAGQTLYELAFTGLPAVAIQMAPNQNFNVLAFEKSGTILSAGSQDSTGFEQKLHKCLNKLVSSKSLRVRMAKAGQRLIDGLGARRIARTILAGVGR